MQPQQCRLPDGNNENVVSFTKVFVWFKLGSTFTVGILTVKVEFYLNRSVNSGI